MKSNLSTRAIVILTVVVICSAGLFFFRETPAGKTEFAFPTSLTDLRANLASRIRLGLDLRGGMHLILQVQADEAVNTVTDQLLQSLPTSLREQGISFTSVQKTDPTHIQILGVPNEGLGPARNYLSDTFSPDYVIGSLTGENNGFVLEMTPSAASRIRQEALRDSIQTIRQRVDSLGVSEPTIAEHGRGEWEILVQLPGVDDPNRVKNILQSTALLEIKLVKDGPYLSQGEALTSRGGILPPDSMLLRESPQARRQAGAPLQWYVVSRSSAVTGRDLRTVRVSRNPELPGFFQVSFTLSRDGAARFGPFTERNQGELLAVVLDGRIQSVATIQQRIDDQGRITGQFDRQTALDLALVLRSGALPASIKYLEERTVGPSLGADSIRAGLTALAVGFIAAVLFMLFYYRFSGVNAVISLLLNLVILLAVLAYFGATLTLPGMAGILLTIGMAVDANVLVFERIREELRVGKTVVSAMEAGFDRAFTTIFDTNATTIMAAVFLYMFGSGPVRGFAVTLTIGLFANVFTAVYVSRTIFEYLLRPRAPGAAAQPATLSI